MTLQVTVAAPFYHAAKPAMSKNELIYYYAFDRKWMDRESVELLLRRACDAGLLKVEDEMFVPTFNVASVHVPIGFRPSSSVLHASDPFEVLLERISVQTGRTHEEVIAEMNACIADEFYGNITAQAAIVCISAKYHVLFSDLLTELEQQMLG
ncbi:MAG: DUF2240 family protein [Methanomicrobiales archaeon]|jgi:hypothetical protein|nr:DUF2240 family protein [Methanomicrobiales archaeon]